MVTPAKAPHEKQATGVHPGRKWQPHRSRRTGLSIASSRGLKAARLESEASLSKKPAKALNNQGTHNGAEEEGEPWLVSYADMMTLLFAFFVLMYTLEKARNTKDEDVVRIKREIASLFGGRTLDTAGVPSVHKVPLETSPTTHGQTLRPTEAMTQTDASGEPEAPGAERWIAAAREELSEKAPLFKLQGGLSGKPVEVVFESATVFALGSAGVQTAAWKALKVLADTLLKLTDDEGQPLLASHDLIVEGHTDDLTLDPRHLYRSNWELSAARAAAIVRTLAEYGVPPRSLVAIGYGDTRPLAPNRSPDGTALEENMRRNRRVVIQIQARKLGALRLLDNEPETPGRREGE